MNSRAFRTRGAAGGAFTLTELMVVIAIIALLIVMLLPVVSGARKHAWATQCASQVHQLGAALLAYANDNGGFLPKPPPVVDERGRLSAEQYAWSIISPGVATFEGGTLVQYLGPSPEARARLMMCPADTGETRSPWNMGGKRNFSYGLNAFLNIKSTDGRSRRVAAIREPSTKILAWETRGALDGLVCFCGGSSDVPSDIHSGRGNHAFVDGHVEALPPWKVAQPTYFRLTDDQLDCGTHWYHPPE